MRLSSSLVRRSPGQVFLWGLVDEHRLGMKIRDDVFTIRDIARPGGPILPPTPNPHVRDAVQVVCRASKTLALTRDGSVWSWGTCENLSLGHGDKVTKVATPKRIEALAGIRIVQIDAGETSSAAVSDTGDVYTWGWGGSFFSGNGGLGHGNRVSQPAPALVEALAGAGGARISSIAVGTAHMLALSTEGVVYSWGNGEYGRCGNGKGTQASPAPVEVLREVPCIQVAAGGAHSFAVGRNGELWGWGKNEASQLGLGASLVADLNSMEEYPSLVSLEGGEHASSFNGAVVRVSTGSNHSIALTQDGSVWLWGARTFLSPTHIPFASRMVGGGGSAPVAGDAGATAAAAPATRDNNIPLRGVAITAGDAVSGVIDAGGSLYTWGKSSHSSTMGHATTGFMGSRAPSLVEALAGVPLSSVSIGSSHGAAVSGAPPPPLPQAIHTSKVV